jgi:hypothetical protein
MEINKKYSYGNFTAATFTQLDPKEFNDTIIKGSCFFKDLNADGDDKWQESFPKDMTGVIFDGCNLDNIYIDEIKNTILPTCTHKLIKTQNDLMTWEIDEVTGKATKPLDTKMFDMLGLSKNPDDIPDTKLDKSVMELAISGGA